MQLKLSRPIAFFDLETTGINIATDRIVEISIMMIQPDGSSEIKTQRVNPTIPIPAVTSEIHGIFDDDVKDEPTFSELADSLYDFLSDCDLAGYNSNRFDLPLLVEEFLREGIEFSVENRRLIDVQRIFHQMEKRDLTAAYRFYCDKELVNAHSAEADTTATYEILEAQLSRYEELKNDMDFLHQFSSQSKFVDFAGRFIYDKNGIERFNFGKHKGKTVEEVLTNEPSYYNWMMKGDFPLYTKKVLQKIKEQLTINN